MLASCTNPRKVGEVVFQKAKGNQRQFGMKDHVGLDSRIKLIHSVAASAATVYDSQALRISCTTTNRGSG